MRLENTYFKSEERPLNFLHIWQLTRILLLLLATDFTFKGRRRSGLLLLLTADLTFEGWRRSGLETTNSKLRALLLISSKYTSEINIIHEPTYRFIRLLLFLTIALWTPLRCVRKLSKRENGLDLQPVKKQWYTSMSTVAEGCLLLVCRSKSFVVLNPEVYPGTWYVNGFVCRKLCLL